MGCEVEIPAESIAVAWWKYLKILVFCRFLRALRNWLGGRDSNPDNVLQRLGGTPIRAARSGSGIA
jgi:hypothetical protein